jgi:hypothetical protein
MIDTQEAIQELRELDEKLRGGGLTPEEQARWEELRASAGADPVAEEPAGVHWDEGPVEQPVELPVDAPADTLPDLVSGSAAELATWDAPPEPVPGAGSPPVPPPDPAYAAVVVEDAEEVEEFIPEVAEEDVQEVLPDAEATVVLAAVSWVDEDGVVGEVVSLDALLATPPPASAESLAPPLPPPLPVPPATLPTPPAAVAEPVGPAASDPFAPSPSFVSGDHRIVLHTVDGQVLRGSLANADLADPELPLIQPNGAVARVPAEQVKAIFFMLPAGERPPAAAGTRVRVTFGDGRQISGLSPDYSPSSSGFFVLPLDGRTNTARVWVYRAAVQQIAIG